MEQHVYNLSTFLFTVHFVQEKGIVPSVMRVIVLTYEL